MNKNKGTAKKEKANDIPKVKVKIPEKPYIGDPVKKDLQEGNKPSVKEEEAKLSKLKTKVEKGEDQHLYKSPAEAPVRTGDLTNDSGIK